MMGKVMNFILFCITWFFVQVFRIMPFPVMQAFSRLLFLLCFYFIRYRREVVFNNLRNAFPEKPEEEIRQTAIRFYRFFCDLITETLKGYTMRIPSLRKRFRAVNPELTDRFFDQGRSVMLIGGHYGNHEWGKILGKQMKHPFQIVYSTFSNPYIEKYQKKTRTMYGMEILPVKKLLRGMTERRHQPYGYIMGVDQRPFDLQNCIWVRFLNQDTPCHQGYEQLARKFNMPVFFIDIDPVKRGYYTFRTVLISENPSSEPEGAIVKAFMKHLQDTIRTRPEYWLWSHKRWKFKKPDGAEVLPLED